MSAPLRTGSRDLGAPVLTPEADRFSAGVCIVSVPGPNRRALFQALYEKHGLIAAPTGGLRLSPHVYNTDDHIRRAPPRPAEERPSGPKHRGENTMALQAPTQLITVAELQDAEDTARVFDCTVHLRPDPPRAYRVESGLADYKAGHIPGAAFLDLQGTLSDNNARIASPAWKTRRSGPPSLPRGWWTARSLCSTAAAIPCGRPASGGCSEPSGFRPSLTGAGCLESHGRAPGHGTGTLRASAR